MAVITLKDLKIESSIKLVSITGLRVEEAINEHAQAYITGVLHEKMSIADVYGINMNDYVKIKALEGSEEKVIFSGIPVFMEMKSLSGVNYITLTLKSHSYKLDIKKISRSFQNVNNQYKSIFKNIVESEHGGILFDAAAKGQVQGRLIIQYDETDWQFIKRLASQISAVVYPFMEEHKPQISVGVPKGSDYSDTSANYEIQKALGEYMLNARNNAGWRERDFEIKVIEGDYICRLCDAVRHANVTYLITKKICELRQGNLVNTYRLQPESVCKQNMFYNELFIGLSIEGRIIAAEADKVKLHLSIDKAQSAGEAYWFTYNTTYAAEGSQGMYIMPEPGMRMEMYMPTQDEARSYARAVIRAGGSGGGKTGNPDIKYLETAWAKELKVSPGGVRMTAKEGAVHMDLDEGGGITFISGGDIVMKGPTIDLKGEKIKMKGGDRLFFKTGSSSMLINTIVDMKGVGDADLHG